MTDWSARQIKPLIIRFTRMATDERSASPGPSQSRPEPVVGGRSIAVHPENFYGYLNDDVLDWFSAFERIARANEWNGAKCGKMVSAYFRGPAGYHFEKLADDEKSEYKTIKQSLINKFSPADMRRSAYSSLAARKQGPRESVNEFASAIQRLVFRAFPSDVTHEVVEMSAREHFILGLRPQLMRRVTIVDPKTFNDAIRIALREESFEENLAAPQRIVAIDQGEKINEVIGLLGKLLNQETGEQNRNFNFRKGNPRNNGTRNKFTRDGRPVCNFCSKPGHIERNCWKKYPKSKEGASIVSKHSEN